MQSARGCQESIFDTRRYRLSPIFRQVDRKSVDKKIDQETIIDPCNGFDDVEGEAANRQ